MTAARITTLVLGSALVTTWLVSGAVTWRSHDQPARPPNPTPPVVTPSPASPEADLHRERLDVRLERIPSPSRSPRNPFRFGSRDGSHEMGPALLSRGQVEAAAAVLVDPARATEGANQEGPPLRLVAIAENRTPDGLVRLAGIAFGDTVVLAKVGDEVDGRYLVTAMSQDVVELRDRISGRSVRLALR